MAREHANIRNDMWNDPDFRELSADAQLLYMQLLTSSTLTYAGVADWRPKRIAALSRGRKPKAVEDAAVELQRGLFIIVDQDTEEVLIRSFLKHDGLLHKPNVVKAMLTAYDKIFSLDLKAVLVFEMQRLSERFPTWKAFGMPEVHELLRNPSRNPSEMVSGTVQERDASLLTTNYLLPTTSNSLPSIDIDALFEQAYSAWPKKVERKKSFDKFRDVCKRLNPHELLEDIVTFGQAYAETTDPKFVPALVVWLNGERWTDELPSRGATQHVRKLTNAEIAMQELGGDDSGFSRNQIAAR